MMRAKMVDDSVPDLNNGVAFEVFRLGLQKLEARLGEEAYNKLLQLVNQVERQFRLDPDETTGEARKGFLLITEMEEFLMDWKAARRRKKDPPRNQAHD
jgi:hypothetical protein